MASAWDNMDSIRAQYEQRKHYPLSILYPLIASPRRGKITLVAFDQLLSNVCFHMSPQTVCMKGCIIALIASVWFFSDVCFQMCLQRACP